MEPTTDLGHWTLSGFDLIQLVIFIATLATAWYKLSARISVLETRSGVEAEARKLRNTELDSTLDTISGKIDSISKDLNQLIGRAG